MIEKISQARLDRYMESGWTASNPSDGRYTLTKRVGGMRCFLCTAGYIIPGALTLAVTSALSIPACIMHCFENSDEEATCPKDCMRLAYHTNEIVYHYFYPCTFSPTKEVEVTKQESDCLINKPPSEVRV